MVHLTRRDALACGLSVTMAADAVLAKVPGGGLVSAPLRVRDAALITSARPRCAWRWRGDRIWQISNAEVDLSTHGDSIFQLGPLAVTVTVVPIHNGWRFGGTITNKAPRSVELQRLDYLYGVPTDAGLGLIAPQGLQGATFTPPRTSAPPRNVAFQEFWSSMEVQWDTAPDPVWDQPDWALSRDIGVFTRGWDQPGWTVGFTGPGTAFGEIGLATGPTPRLFVGQLLEGIRLDPAETRRLERCTMRYGDWQDGVRQWAEDTARAIKPRPQVPAPVGYCSWYQLEQAVTPANVRRAAREVASLPVPPGGRIVQIDDGWEVAEGAWIQNAKFGTDYVRLPSEIAATGSVPGTYISPLFVRELTPPAKAHPEWMQRRPDGKPSIVFAQEGVRKLVIDPDHPGAQGFLRAPFERTRAEGWGYVKVDFTYALAPDRVPANPKRTSFETQRALYQTIRDAIGPEMRMNACVGEPARYAIGSADACRLGGDIGGPWATVKSSLLPLLIHAPVGGRWFAADPDVFSMRQEKIDLTEEECWLWTGSVGLMGGLFLTSDLPSQWSSTARARVARFWNAAGPRTPVTQRIVFNPRGVLQAYRVSYADGLPTHRIGLYNWADTPADVVIPLADAQLTRIRVLGGDEGPRLVGNAFVSRRQPPHSIRILDLAAI